MILIPNISRITQNGNYTSDIFSCLLNQRIIFLNDHINTDNALITVSQMLYLESENPHKDIFFYINSPGGSVPDGNAIIDIMDDISCDVSTICMGRCNSMAAVILSSGTKGKRYAFKSSEIMFHTVSAGYWGKEKDVEISAERIKILNENLLTRIANNCDKSFDKIKTDLDRDFFLSADGALEYGAIDTVITK